MDKTIIDTDKTQFENKNNITKVDNEIIYDQSTFNKIDKIFNSKYEIIKQLPSSGAEADIYIVKNDNKEYILKLYRYGIEPSNDIKNKLIAISEKYPDDIVRIYEITFDEESNRWFELQEYAKYGSLKDLINHNISFVKKNLNIIIKEIALLLKSIHKENIIHRDLKPDNILIRTIEPLDLIITDFGISSIINEEMSKKMTSKSGTKIYFSPESFSGYIGQEVDYWALGMIILEIIEEGNLFIGMHEGLIANEIFTKGIEIPNNIDEEYSKLLKGLLTRDPKYRWNYNQIEKWLQGEPNIPNFYNYTNETNSNNLSKQFKTPFIFENEKFYTIESLFEKLYTVRNYKTLNDFIMRGLINTWLENNEYYNEVIFIDNILDRKLDINVSIFIIVNNFIKTDKFIIDNKIATINSVYYIYKKDNNIILKISENIKEPEFKKYLTIVDSELESLFSNILEAKSLIINNENEIDCLFNIYLEKKITYKLVRNQKVESFITVNKIFSENNNISNTIIENIENGREINLKDLTGSTFYSLFSSLSALAAVSSFVYFIILIFSKDTPILKSIIVFISTFVFLWLFLTLDYKSHTKIKKTLSETKDTKKKSKGISIVLFSAFMQGFVTILYLWKYSTNNNEDNLVSAFYFGCGTLLFILYYMLLKRGKKNEMG